MRSTGADVFGLEVAAEDKVYEWDRIAHGRYNLATIFPNRKYEEIAASELRAGVVQALDKSGCNIVALNGWSVPEARAALGWRRGARSRRAVLMSETKRDDGRRYWWKEWVKRRFVARCDTALVGGRVQADYLGQLGLDRERIFTGYDAVDNAYFKAGAGVARRSAVQLRRHYRLPDRYFLACTRFLSRKNVDGLLQSYQRYRRGCEGQPWGLVILGSGAQADRLRQLEHRLAVDQVLWAGFVQYDALPVFYGLASAFIHPAKSEPWGLVVNEAAASGLPLLVSRTVGARYELVEQGANGYLFDPFEVEDMAQAMTRLSRLDKPALQQMGERSAEIVAEWSPRNFGEQLMRAAELAATLPDR